MQKIKQFFNWILSWFKSPKKQAFQPSSTMSTNHSFDKKRFYSANRSKRRKQSRILDERKTPKNNRKATRGRVYVFYPAPNPNSYQKVWL